MAGKLQPQPIQNQRHNQQKQPTALTQLNKANSRSATLSPSQRHVQPQSMAALRTSAETLENVDRRGASSFLAQNKFNSRVPRSA